MAAARHGLRWWAKALIAFGVAVGIVCLGFTAQYLSVDPIEYDNRILRTDTPGSAIDVAQKLDNRVEPITGKQGHAGVAIMVDRIEQVLPLFHNYAEGTILVGHNAAFDMRLLQEKEALTGIRFDNPVLDTMLLSAVAHPAHNNHDIETIAERLGITIVGRHTALGDAIATGEIFLKLLAALSGLGIHTLGQAREASQKTFYARIAY